MEVEFSSGCGCEGGGIQMEGFGVFVGVGDWSSCFILNLFLLGLGSTGGFGVPNCYWVLSGEFMKFGEGGWILLRKEACGGVGISICICGDLGYSSRWGLRWFCFFCRDGDGRVGDSHLL